MDPCVHGAGTRHIGHRYSVCLRFGVLFYICALIQFAVTSGYRRTSRCRQASQRFLLWGLPHRKVLIAAKSFAVITNTFIRVRYLSPEKLWKSPLRVFVVHRYPPFLHCRYTFPARRTVTVFKAKNYIMIHYLRISFPRTLTYLFDRIVL